MTYASNFTYDNADRLLTAIDARGAIAAYAYNRLVATENTGFFTILPFPQKLEKSESGR